MTDLIPLMVLIRHSEEVEGGKSVQVHTHPVYHTLGLRVCECVCAPDEKQRSAGPVEPPASSQG